MRTATSSNRRIKIKVFPYGWKTPAGEVKSSRGKEKRKAQMLVSHKAERNLLRKCVRLKGTDPNYEKKKKKKNLNCAPLPTRELLSFLRNKWGKFFLHSRCWREGKKTFFSRRRRLVCRPSTFCTFVESRDFPHLSRQEPFRFFAVLQLNRLWQRQRTAEADTRVFPRMRFKSFPIKLKSASRTDSPTRKEMNRMEILNKGV